MVRAVVILLVALLLPTAARAFLFDRAQFIEAPFLGIVRAFAVVNASQRVVVSVGHPLEDQISRQALYMTLTLPLNNSNSNNPELNSIFVSRPLPDMLQEVDFISATTYLSDDGALLWLYCTPPNVIAISVANCTVVSNISLDSEFADDWQLLEHANGAPFPLVRTARRGESTFVWPLPDGQQAKVAFGEDTAWFASATPDGTPMLYTVNVTEPNWTTVLAATAVNLTDASLTYAASNLVLPPVSPYWLTRCSFSLNATSIAYLGAWDDAAAIVWTLDRASLALSAQFFTAPEDFIGFDLTCGPTTVPSQLLLWEVAEVTYRTGSILVYLLDLVNASVTPVSLPLTDGFFVTAIEALGDGGVVYAECDTWEDKPGSAQQCNYVFVNSFNASRITRDASIGIGSARPTYGTSIERNGHVATVFENLSSSTPAYGLMVTDASDPAVPVAYVSLPRQLSPDTGLITMDDSRVYVCPWNWDSDITMLVTIRFRNFESYSSAGALYLLSTSSAINYLQLEVYNNTLVLLSTVSWLGRSAIELYSLANMEMTSKFLPNLSLSGLSFQGESIYAYGISGIVQLSTDLRSVLRRWPLQFTSNTLLPLASVATSDSFYAFFDDSGVVCARLPLNTDNAYEFTRCVPICDAGLATRIALTRRLQVRVRGAVKLRLRDQPALYHHRSERLRVRRPH